MKLITSTGLFNTGSSAITHLLSEIHDVYAPDNVYEMRFLYDPDCISDLEYYLCENPHRQNSSLAIKRFKKYIDFNSNPILNHHYEKMFNGKFKKISYEYIKDISLFDFNGFSHIDKYEKGGLFWFVDRCYIRILAYLFSTRERPKWLKPSLISLKTKQYAGVYNNDEFIRSTHKYINSLFYQGAFNNHEYMIIDQLFPATNVDRYLRYIPDDIEKKVFIVDRDPRDLYVTFKYFLNEKGIPCSNAEDFCNWFMWTRSQAEKFKYDDSVVKKIRFEDMIYDYDRTRNDILGFIGIDSDCKCDKFSKFDPSKSINNTQVWYRYPNANEEVKIIENTLGKYLYDFAKFDFGPKVDSGNMFDC